MDTLANSIIPSKEDNGASVYINPIFTEEVKKIWVFPVDVEKYISAPDDECYFVAITDDERKSFSQEMQQKSLLTRPDVIASAPELHERIKKEIREQFIINSTCEHINDRDNGWDYFEEMKYDVEKNIYTPEEPISDDYFSMVEDVLFDEYEDIDSPLYQWFAWSYTDHLSDFDTNEEIIEYLQDRFGLYYDEYFDTMDIDYCISATYHKPKER